MPSAACAVARARTTATSLVPSAEEATFHQMAWDLDQGGSPALVWDALEVLAGKVVLIAGFAAQDKLVQGLSLGAVK
jgi:hypothetical protein